MMNFKLNLMSNTKNTNFGKTNVIKNSNILLQQQHPYHLVDPSPWPLVTAISSLGLTTGTVMYMHANNGGGFLAFFSFVMLIVCMGLWWRDVVREATFEGHHTFAVQQGFIYCIRNYVFRSIFLGIFSREFSSKYRNWCCMASKRNYPI